MARIWGPCGGASPASLTPSMLTGAPDHALPGCSTPPPPSNGRPLPPRQLPAAPGPLARAGSDPATGLRNAPSAILFSRPASRASRTRGPRPPLLVAEGTPQTWAARAAALARSLSLQSPPPAEHGPLGSVRTNQDSRHGLLRAGDAGEAQRDREPLRHEDP